MELQSRCDDKRSVTVSWSHPNFNYSYFSGELEEYPTLEKYTFEIEKV